MSTFFVFICWFVYLLVTSARLLDTCTQDTDGTSHVLFYANANDITGGLSVYAWSTRETPLRVGFETPNLPPGSNGVDEEKTTSISGQVAIQEFPTQFAVSIHLHQMCLLIIWY